MIETVSETTKNPKQEIASLYVQQLTEKGKVFGLFSSSIEDFILSEDDDIFDKLGSAIKAKFGGQLLGLKEETIADIQAMREEIQKAKNQADLEALKERIIGSTSTSIPTAPNDVSSPLPSTLSAVVSTPMIASSVELPFNASITQRYEMLTGVDKPSLQAFTFAMQGYEKLKGKLKNPDYLTIVDYTKSRNENRMYVINLKTNRVEYLVPVGHGKKSGGTFARSFSNEIGSNETSLGFYRTPLTIKKSRTKKRSGLLLQGIEESNDQAVERGIYIHPGPVNGSEGCFTLPNKANEIMNKVKGDSLLFAYYPDKEYLAQSDLVNPSVTGYGMVA